MARRKKNRDMGGPETPEWVVTFSDIISLLVTFFVLLLTYSSFDSQKFQLARGSIQGSLGVMGQQKENPSIESRSISFIKTPTKKYSEVPSVYEGEEGNPLQYKTKIPISETEHKVCFLLQTQITFLGSSTKLPQNAYPILESILNMLKYTKNEVTIKCYAYVDAKSPKKAYVLAGTRAFKIWNYFIKNNIDANRVSIASCMDQMPLDVLPHKQISKVDIIVWNRQPKNF